MVDRRRELGDRGESMVADWYAAAGYSVLERNWRCREGELDLIAAAPSVLVFCEVKTRRAHAYGQPFEAVTAAKQRRIRGLAARWLAERRVRAPRIRFDVASVTAAPGSAPVIDVIQDAF